MGNVLSKSSHHSRVSVQSKTSDRRHSWERLQYEAFQEMEKESEGHHSRVSVQSKTSDRRHSWGRLQYEAFQEMEKESEEGWKHGRTFSSALSSRHSLSLSWRHSLPASYESYRQEDETVTLSEQTSADNNTDFNQGKLVEQKQSDETQAKFLGLEKTSTVDSKGNLIELGDCSLTIPSASLSGCRYISIVLEDPVQFYGVFDDVGLFPCVVIASPVIKLRPSSLQFTHPPLLEAKLFRNAREDEEITVLCGHHVQDEEESTKIIWADVTRQCTLDEDCQKISIHIQHFSWYVVLYKSVVIGTKALISRLNLTTFKYHVAVYIKRDHPQDSSCDLHVVFMSSHIYRETSYSQQERTVLTRLKEQEFEFVCESEGSYVYSGLELTIRLKPSAECRLSPQEDGVRKIAVNPSTWWSSGDEVCFAMQGVESNDFASGCVEVEEGDNTLKVTFKADDWCRYIANAFKLGPVANLMPLAQELGLSDMEKRSLVNDNWQCDRHQLDELQKIRSSSKPDETSKELTTHMSSIDLKGGQHVSQRGQMHVENLRELRNNADSTIDGGSTKEESINKTTKHMMDSFLHDCCIQIMSSCESMKALEPTKYSLNLFRKNCITREVHERLEEWFTTTTATAYQIIAKIIPELIQMTKEVFTVPKELPELDGMWGLDRDDSDIQSIISVVNEAVKNNESVAFFWSIREVLAKLCFKNERLLQEKKGLKKEDVEKWKQWGNLEELLKAVNLFMRNGEASKTRMRIETKGSHFSSIEGKKERGKHLVRDLGNLVFRVIEFAEFDPSHLARFSIQSELIATLPNGYVTYNKTNRMFAQDFLFPKTAECEYGLSCHLDLNADGKQETIGTLRAEIISEKVEDVQRDLLFTDQSVKMVLHQTDRKRMIIHGTCKETLVTVMDRVKKNRVKKNVHCMTSNVETSDKLKLVRGVGVANANTLLLTLFYHCGDQGISYEGEGLTIPYEDVIPAELVDANALVPYGCPDGQEGEYAAEAGLSVSSALVPYECTREKEGTLAVEGGCTSQNGGEKILQTCSAISRSELQLFASDLSFPVAKEKPIEENESGGALVVTSEIEEYSRTAEPEHVVKDMENYLNVDSRALESPSVATCGKIRSFSNYLKTMERQDIVAKIKRRLPSAAGPLVPEEMLLRDMEYSVLSDLSIALSGEGWKKLADYLGIKIERMMFLERLPNPGLLLLQMCAVRDLTAGQLYDILVACGLEMLADKI